MGVIWKSWQPEKVKTMIKDDLVENMEIACKVVETDARKRLLAISEPRKGAKYRSGVVARRLTYVVRREVNAVVGYVGIRLGTKPVSGAQHIGMWIEMGSHTAPPHPYLRPAVFQNAREIVRLVSGQ